LEGFSTYDALLLLAVKDYRTVMPRFFLKRKVLRGKEHSPPITVNEQPLVFSSQSAHKTTTDFSGNPAQEVRKTE
jgi:hypothetical protein